MSWECRLCPETCFTRGYMSEHLERRHGITGGLDGPLTLGLLACKDYPDSSENTFGYWDEQERLIAAHIQTSERAADDPMRLG